MVRDEAFTVTGHGLLVRGAAELLLAGAWYRAGRRSWRATAAILAMVMVAVLLVSGLFAGMRLATGQRVADFYTSDLRLTPERPGAASQAAWEGDGLRKALEVARAQGGQATARMESQFILSRRSLIEAYLEEQDQYTVGNIAGETRSGFYGVGVLVGLPTAEPAALESLRPYLVSGRLPAAGDRAQILMSVNQFRSYLAKGEIANLSAWPPSGAELSAYRFEVTAARVHDQGVYKDIIRRPAEVVGLYETGLDALDGFTLVTDIGEVRQLLGHQANATVANAITIAGGDPAASAAQARRHGWASEEPADFTQRYLGQLLEVLAALALLMAALFFALPLFLLWHGLQQILERQRREVAVCRAIGVPAHRLGRAFALVVARVVLLGAVSAALIVGGLRIVLPGLLADWQAVPIPMTFVVSGQAVATLAVVTVASAALALAFALRRGKRADLAGILRTA